MAQEPVAALPWFTASNTNAYICAGNGGILGGGGGAPQYCQAGNGGNAGGGGGSGYDGRNNKFGMGGDGLIFIQFKITI